MRPRTITLPLSLSTSKYQHYCQFHFTRALESNDRVVCNILEKDLDIYDATVMPPAILVWDQLPHDTKSSRYKITVEMFCPSHPRS